MNKSLYRLRCTTEGLDKFTLSTTVPTVCPDDSGHTINVDSITEVKSGNTRPNPVAVIAPDMADFALSTSIWSKTLTGSGGSSIISGDGAHLKLGTTTASRALSRMNIDENMFPFWDRSPVWHAPSILFIDNAVPDSADSYESWAVIGCKSSIIVSSDKYVGWKVSVVAGVITLKAANCDGITEKETTITGVDLKDSHSFTVIVRSGVYVEFYIDGVLKAVHTVNIPDGERNQTTNAHMFFFGLDRYTSGVGTKDFRMRLSPMSISYRVGA